VRQVESALAQKTKFVKGNLPQDLSKDIPKEPYTWLKSYALTNEEISGNNIGWSEENSVLVFPFYGENNNVLCWQGRYFPARNPKVYTSGYPDNHILLHVSPSGGYSKRVIVVEDSVSAIKVSRVCDSTELLGSNLSKHKAVGLSKLYNHLTIWLDYDKIKEMVKFTEKYRCIYDKIDFIITKKDPKEYSTYEIKEILKNDK
jgi:hypothetical protein